MTQAGTDLEGVAGARHLILGGSGFIGFAVALRLARAGARVVLADRTPPIEPLPETLPGTVTFTQFDLATADWDTLIIDVDVVHHYAWASIPASASKDPAADLVTNVWPTLRLLESMGRLGTRAPRLVFASSGGTVYGRLNQVPVPEDHPLRPITAYGAGKATVELYLSQHRASHGQDCRVARLVNPFGARQNVARGQGAATAFLHHALRGTPIEIWGDGSVTRDYVHISDVADGLVALSTRRLPNDQWVFNIGSGAGVSLNELVAVLERQLGRRLAVTRLGARGFDVPVSVLDIRQAALVLGWTPSLTFGDGLARTIKLLTSGASPAGQQR